MSGSMYLSTKFGEGFLIYSFHIIFAKPYTKIVQSLLKILIKVDSIMMQRDSNQQQQRIWYALDFILLTALLQ